MDDTAPMDAVDLPSADGRAALRQLADQVEVAEKFVPLQGNQALIAQMQLPEIEEARRVEALRRRADREFETWQISRSLRSRKWQARRSAVRHWLDDRAAAKDRDAEAGDRRWHTRAQRTQRRLTSIDARIATQIRSATRWSNLLIGFVIVGMAYTGFTVQHNFVPGGNTADPRYWLSLGLEAMCSLAFMSLMRADARAAAAGQPRSGWKAAVGWVVKGVLLVFSLLASAGPALLAHATLQIVSTGWAPVMVAGVLVIHDQIARSDAAILLGLYADLAAAEVRDFAAQIRFAMDQGLIAPSQTAGDIAPSATKIASLLRINKAVAMRVRDEVAARAAETAA